jgi:hypothetical protein
VQHARPSPEYGLTQVLDPADDGIQRQRRRAGCSGGGVCLLRWPVNQDACGGEGEERQKKKGGVKEHTR